MFTITDVSPTRSNMSFGPNWQDVTGRMLSVASSEDGKLVFAGSLSSGLWVSEDSGKAWVQLVWEQRKADRQPGREVMSLRNFSPSRRALLAACTAAAAFTFTPERRAAFAADGDKIQPFHVSVPEEQLADLRRRIASTRWPDRETVNDQSQG